MQTLGPSSKPCAAANTATSVLTLHHIAASVHAILHHVSITNVLYASVYVMELIQMRFRFIYVFSLVCRCYCDLSGNKYWIVKFVFNKHILSSVGTRFGSVILRPQYYLYRVIITINTKYSHFTFRRYLHEIGDEMSIYLYCLATKTIKKTTKLV